MTFIEGLSMPHRRCRSVVAGALILACTQSQEPAGGSTGPVLTALEITPAAMTLGTGDSAVFHALGRLEDGSSAAAPVNWAATGGAISSSGVFHAGTVAGSFRVVASTAQPALADTAVVTISAAPVPVILTGVTVTPALDSLLPGAGRQFTVTGHYSNGATDTVSVAWSATGGAVSTGGTYQAGTTPGSYVVIATALAAARADTAHLVIRDTSSAGGTVLLSEPFEDAAVQARGWYDNTNPVVTTTERHSGAAALEMAWTAGAQKPVRGGAMRRKFTPTDRVFVRYWVKYSANYVGSGKTYHPHEFHVVTTEDGDWIGPSASHLTTYIEQNYQNGGIPRLAITDALNIDTTRLNVDLTSLTEQRAVAGCNGSSDGYPTNCYQSGGQWFNEKIWRAPQPMFLATTGPGSKNEWHEVRVYFQLNSIAGGRGRADGVAQYWFDGQLVIDKRDVLFRTGAHPTMLFRQFIIAPYIGPGSPVAQAMWVDDLTVATGPVP